MEGKYRLSGYPLLAIYRNEELHDVSNVVLKNGKVFYSKEKEKVPDAKYIDYGISLLESKYFDSYPQRFDLAELIENLSYKQILDHYEVKTRFYEIGSFSGYDETIKLLKR